MKYTLIGAAVGAILAWLLPTWVVVIAGIAGLLWIIKGIEA